MSQSGKPDNGAPESPNHDTTQPRPNLQEALRQLLDLPEQTNSSLELVIGTQFL